MINQSQLNEIANFVRHFLHETAETSNQAWVRAFPRAAEHRWQHTLNVLKNAGQILEGEGTDDYTSAVVRASALLHDVSMFTCDHAIHAKVSAEIAADYLQEQNYDEDLIKAVCRAVAEHGTDFGDIPPAEQGERFSWAGKVLIEADILDKLGASAVTSSLMSLGEQRKLNFEAHSELLRSRAFEKATFFKDYTWTETGKQMAERRYTFFKDYLVHLKEEVVETVMPEWHE